MVNGTERRASRRFTMALPLTVRANGPSGTMENNGKTRDVSFRGLFFTTDGEFQPGTQIEFVLTLPKEITQAGDVNIRCYGQVVRVEPSAESRGIAARIDRYEFIAA
jgi:PilZ domain